MILPVAVPETFAVRSTPLTGALPDAGVALSVTPSVAVGTVFATVTVLTFEVVTLPAASRATAVSACAPLLAALLVHAIEYGAD